MFSAAADAARVQASFHALRHTFATAMLRFPRVGRRTSLT